MIPCVVCTFSRTRLAPTPTQYLARLINVFQRKFPQEEGSVMKMSAANKDLDTVEQIFVSRTRNVSLEDLDQALDRLALGKSHYCPNRWTTPWCSSIAANLPPKQQNDQVQDYVDTICGYAYQYGLSTLTLTATLGIATGSKSLSQANRALLIKSLYPAGELPLRIICTAVASLGQGKQKLPVSLQQLLLKWIIQVYEGLEDPSSLSKLYSALFNMLDTMSLRYDLILGSRMAGWS